MCFTFKTVFRSSKLFFHLIMDAVEKLNILLIEDDVHDQAFIQECLQSTDIVSQILIKPGLKLGEAQLRTNSFHVIIIDQILPDGTGIDFLQKLRNANNDIPVILITGQGDESTAVEAMRAGASDYMPKDKISSRSISRSIQRSIESYHLVMRAKQAEFNLSENEKRYRTIVETVSDFIFELNTDGKIIFANSAFKMLGYEREELINRHIREFLVSDNLEEIINQVATRGVGPMATTNLEILFKTNEDSTIFGEMGTAKMFLDAFGVWDVPAEIAFKNKIKKKFLRTVCIGRDIPTSGNDILSGF